MTRRQLWLPVALTVAAAGTAALSALSAQRAFVGSRGASVPPHGDTTIATRGVEWSLTSPRADTLPGEARRIVVRPGRALEVEGRATGPSGDSLDGIDAALDGRLPFRVPYDPDTFAFAFRIAPDDLRDADHIVTLQFHLPDGVHVVVRRLSIVHGR